MQMEIITKNNGVIIGGINPNKLTFISANGNSLFVRYTDGEIYEIIFYGGVIDRPIAIAVVKAEMPVDNQEVLEYFNAEGNYDIEKWESNQGVNPEKLTYIDLDPSGFYFEYLDGKAYRIIYYDDNTQNRPVAVGVVEL